MQQGEQVGETSSGTTARRPSRAGTHWRILVDVSGWLEIGVVAFILVMLAIDLLVFQKDPHEVRMREAVAWSCFWVACGLLFAVVVWITMGSKPAGEYLAGYLIEKSLSVDNIFVFALVLSYFSVPPRLQHRVLFYGVLGALVMRAAFILLGATLLEEFAWTIYVFGAFLVFTGIRMARHGDVEVHPDKNPVLRLMRRVIPMAPDYHGDKFFVRQGVRRYATPLLAVLLVVETTDLVFAVDSIPAIFAVTKDTFLVFTSNAFAILGLRALYFVLAGAMGRFVHLKTGLAAVLVFVGIKMLLSETYHIPIGISLAFIALILTVSIVASLRSTRVAPGSATDPEALPEEAS
jgi:tellurite resistance protein TerC